MSSPSASATTDALATIRDAVALVCAVDASSLSGASRFDDLGADSLARVSIADVVEASIAAASGRVVHIDDTALGDVTTLGQLAEYVGAR